MRPEDRAVDLTMRRAQVDASARSTAAVSEHGRYDPAARVLREWYLAVHSALTPSSCGTPTGYAELGINYAYAGETFWGPPRGVAQGAAYVGFDCSGLVRYAWYGQMIEAPHTGAQVPDQQRDQRRL